MIVFKITHVGNEFDPVYIDTTYGERFCEVLDGAGVAREKRARIMANALAFYWNHVYPNTSRGSKAVRGFPQMELQFEEE